MSALHAASARCLSLGLSILRRRQLPAAWESSSTWAFLLARAINSPQRTSFPIPKFVQPFSSSMFIPWIFNGIESSDYRSINRTGFLGNLTVKLPQVLLLIPSMVFASPWADTLPSFQLKYSVVVLRVTTVHWHPLLHADQHGDGRSDISKRGFLFTKLTLANVFLVACLEQNNWFH